MMSVFIVSGLELVSAYSKRQKIRVERRNNKRLTIGEKMSESWLTLLVEVGILDIILLLVQ